MFFTGFTRFSSEVQKANNVSGSEEKRVRLKKMYELVDEAEGVLTNKNRDLDDFGRLLDTTWRLKKGTGGAISTGSIDELYEKGISAGALGGKLLGAGGGGFLVFYVQPEHQKDVKEAMKQYKGVYFGAIGGAGAIIASCIKSCEIIAYEDLGPEAVRRLVVEDLPLTVVIDSEGHDLYEIGRQDYLKGKE